MKIVFDQGVPVPLRTLLAGHEIATAYELGWNTLKNGELIGAAENSACDLLLTTDQNLKYQQNLAERTISIVVLLSTSWPRIQKHIGAISGHWLERSEAPMKRCRFPETPNSERSASQQPTPVEQAWERRA